MPDDLLPNEHDGGFGIYIHWPFCQAKCPYCDFNSHVRHGGIDETMFERAFRSELTALAQLTGRAAGQDERHVDSIFFGGGTPSLMSPALVGRLLDDVADHWDVSSNLEVTLEANPTSVEADKFKGFRSAGVNRISLGVQSLNDADLKSLGRLHTADEARAAIDIGHAHFERVSFDLIYARPNHVPADWERELRLALELGCDHLSLYQLTIEPGTPFAQLYDSGKLTIPPGQQAYQLFEITQSVCEDAGLPAYEISNHARPGHECAHNLIYWRYGDYAGVGPGAHGRITTQGERIGTATERQPERWVERVGDKGDGIIQRDVLTAAEQADEMILMGLRLREGLDLWRLEAMTGAIVSPNSLRQLARDTLAMVSDDGRMLIVSDQGRFVLNELVLRVSSSLTFVDNSAAKRRLI